MRRQASALAAAAVLAALLTQASALNAHATGSTCTSASLNSTSPQPSGTVINFYAFADCTSPEFKFFVQSASGAWVAKTAYGVYSWSLDTIGWTAGVYGVGVWARQQGSIAAYETYWIGTFVVSVSTCDVTSIVFSAPFEPAPPGTQVSVTATASVCASPQFMFWIRQLSGSWYVARGWGASSWTWDTTGLAYGYYQVGVWARQPTSPNSYDAYAIRTFPIFPAVSGSCHEADIAFSPTDDTSPPIAPGTQVQLSANSSCGPPVYYKWWLKPPGGSWEQSAYSQLLSATWDTSGIDPGTYQVGLWAEPSATYPRLSTYGAYDIESYTLSVGRCNAATIFPDSVNPNLTAAGASGCTTPEYEFWLLPAGSTTWRMVQAYSSSTNTYSLDTTGLAPGPYRIGVWVRQTGASTSYDSYAILTRWI